MPLFERELRYNTLNSPAWFPWQQGERHLNCIVVDRGTPSWLPRDTSEGHEAAIRATTKENR